MTRLKSTLSFPVILFITINSIIGSGLFFLPAIGAKVAGPASIISWAILSIVALYVAMCFGELVSMFPTAGGIYEFSKQAYGRMPSFIIGWIAWLVGSVTTAMLIVGAITYLLPYNTTTFIIAKILVSLLWVVLFNYMAYRGIKLSAVLLVTFAVITVSLIVALIVPALFHLNVSNIQPFFIGKSFTNNLTLIILAVFFISEAFFGLESVCFLAEETKDPKKTLPKALIYAVIIIGALTIGLVVVSLLAVNWKQFAFHNAPFAFLAYSIGGNIFKNIVTIWTYLVIIGAAAGWVVTGPRLILALTRDKLFPRQFGAIHKKYHTPHKAILFQAILTSIFILISFKGNGYETLLSLLIPLVLIMTFAVLIVVPILRYKRKDIPRPFKAPFGKSLPYMFALFHLFLIVMWIIYIPNSWSLLKLGIAFILFGIPLYLLVEMYYDKKFIIKIIDAFAFLTLLTENIYLPKSIRREILKIIGNVKGKRLLEFGCGVGTLTLWLSEAVGKTGKIYATDMSHQNIKIVEKRIRKKNITHVKTIHDINHATRVHPDVPKVNGVVSVGVLSYLQNPQKVLREINQRLKINDKIIFVDYDKFFRIIPNRDWLNSDFDIVRMFDKAGFKTKVRRKQGLLWQYIFIEGKKYKKF